MRVPRTIRQIIFYGHVWIALAAAALTWLSVSLSFPAGSVEAPLRAGLPAILLAATFGVYTLHRLLSFRKAGVLPETKRYRIVRRFPKLSAVAGVTALVVAAFPLVPLLYVLWWPLLIAGAMTLFYLVPPLPSGRRLRDLPYLKSLWVATSWMLMTHDIPTRIVRLYVEETVDCALEYPVRFAFTLAVALLFDLRDVDLDRAQGVRTVANAYPVPLRWICRGLFVGCAALSYRHPELLAGYLAMIPVAELTYARRDEDWYAVWVNGLLLLPPLLYFLVGRF